MKNKFLKEITNKLYPLLVLEDIVSHDMRVFLKKIFGAASLMLFLAALFVHNDYTSVIKGAFCLSLLLWIWIMLIESYFYSLYENAENETGAIPFEVAKILFYCEESDLTQGFLFSDIGDETLKRLEFSEDNVKDFLRERSGCVVDLKEILGESFTFQTYIKAVYDNDEALQTMLLKKNIQYKDFEGAFVWVLKKTEDRIEAERFWSKEKLSRIEGIGKNWSYGETYILDRYGRDITEAGSSHFEGYQSMHEPTVRKLESVLSRSKGANAIVISEDEASRMDIVTMLARFISQGVALSPLAKKRVYVIDTNLLIENSSDKLSFERNLTDVLIQAMTALNVIVVIPYFSTFLKSAETIGSDALSIIRPFFLSPVLHIIGLDSNELFQNHLANNASIMENFEIIKSEQNDSKGALLMLEEAAEEIEKQTKFFFTYPALTAIAEGAKRYFDAFAFADKARDLVLESVPFAAASGSRIINREIILELIESKTGVPTEAPKGEEKALLLNLEAALHKRVVGQEEAVKAISTALRRSRSGVRNPDRPIGSFLFLGPTGVGKTETTKSLADTFFGSEDKISRLDMSEYQNTDALAKLIGYFGSPEQGLLVSKIRERPYGVMLLDEFEKTNRDVLNIFLQVFDEGQFTDSTGKSVNARNNIFIATSNAGSSLIWDIFQRGENPSDHKNDIIDSIIQQGVFKPGLVNRFDAVILFHPLATEHLRKIASIQITKLASRMREKSIIIKSSDSLIDYLVSKGTDPKFGARPMNRAIQDEVEQIIAEKIINGEISPGSEVSFDMDADSVLKVTVR